MLRDRHAGRQLSSPCLPLALTAALLAAAATLSLAAAANDSEGNELARLARIKTQLADVQTALRTDAGALSAARDQAFALEREIEEMASSLAPMAARIKSHEQKIAALRAESAELEAVVRDARQVLERSMLARYVITMQPRMKLLLNQSEAAAFSRTLAYYDYTERAYQREFSAFERQARHAADAAATLKLEAAALRQLRADNEARLAALKQTRGEHDTLIAAIEQRLAEGNNRAQELRRDQQRLADLLERLAAVAPVEPATPAAPAAKVAPAEPFSSLKGRLEWPAEGRVTKAPGARLRSGGARWAGVFIASTAGTAVTSIAAGEVVFADWFRNLGKLVIVDHGDGYLTLYGNNAELHKRPGDRVRAGDTIASAGQGTGGLPAGVYFEIRQRGEPVDPRKWFARR